MKHDRTVSRNQLYRELWTEPALVVAKRYGISDVGLAKVCRRFGIPKPGLGYWAQRQAGKAPAQPPLPPSESAALETVYFQTGDQPAPRRNVPEYEREKDPDWLIRVPPDLALSHPLVKATAAACIGRRNTHATAALPRPLSRTLVRAGDGCLDIAVSKPLIPRALRVMQSLVSALEKRGYYVSVTKRRTRSSRCSARASRSR